MKYKVSDINSLDIFKLYLKQEFPNINDDNEDLVKQCYLVFLNTNTNRMRCKFDSISNYLKSRRNGKSSSVLSLEYWKSMGWDDVSVIQDKISFEQKCRSPLSKEYYIKQGIPEDEYTRIIKEIQCGRNEKSIKKYTYDDRLKRCKWSKEYWIDKGYSENDALIEVHKLNGMCPEKYENIDDYISIIKRHSDRQRKLYKLNPEKYWKKNLGYESKEEIDVFNEISKYLYDLKHLHIGINVQGTDLELKYNKQYVLSDGYIKIENKIILFEYDGSYWHNNEYDELRDDILFSVRNDIIGIIRISDTYFKSNDIKKIINDIKYAIEDIKSKKCKRKLLY